MAQITALTTLYPFMVSHVGGADAHQLKLELEATAIDFCRRTDAWREDMDPFPAYIYKQDYVLAMPNGYSAQFHRMLSLKINSQKYTPNQYDLYEDGTLRLESTSVPQDLDDRLLACKVQAAMVYTDWTGVTAGSGTFSVDSNTYLASPLDFSSCLTMDQVAAVLQTGIRNAMENNTVFVRWDGTRTKFLVWVESGEVSYLTAGTSGTDITGDAYMGGLSTSSGVLVAGLVEARVVLRADRGVDAFPDWFLDRWHNALIAGALARLHKQPNKPYTDANAAKEQQFAYNEEITKALAENGRSYKDAPTIMVF